MFMTGILCTVCSAQVYSVMAMVQDFKIPCNRHRYQHLHYDNSFKDIVHLLKSF